MTKLGILIEPADIDTADHRLLMASTPGQILAEKRAPASRRKEFKQAFLHWKLISRTSVGGEEKLVIFNLEQWRRW